MEDREGTVPAGLVLLATERLDTDFDAVRRLVGFDVPQPPARRNVSEGPEVEVSPHLAREIERRYAQDFELHDAALR